MTCGLTWRQHQASRWLTWWAHGLDNLATLSSLWRPHRYSTGTHSTVTCSALCACTSACTYNILEECNALLARYATVYALIAKLEVTVLHLGAKLCALSAKLEIAVWHRLWYIGRYTYIEQKNRAHCTTRMEWSSVLFCGASTIYYCM